jgi:drug/metabolite transporter (DMT)-like permease
MATRYQLSAPVMMGWLGVNLVLFGIPFAFIAPFQPGTPAGHMAAIFGGGASFGVALSILYRVLRKAEASRAIPVFNTAPVFVAIIAVFVLGDPLTAWQWVAIIVAVLGAVVISTERGPGVLGFGLGVTFFALLVAAGFAGFAHVLTGYALKEVEPMTAFWAMRMGCLVFVALNWRKETTRQMLASARKPVVVALALGAEAGVFPLGHILMLRAFDTGPVALVATLVSTVPVWVFLVSTLLSTSWLKLMDEPLQRRTLAVKLVAIAMVVGGVAVIALL